MLIILMTKVDYGFFYRIFNGFFHQFFKSANFSSARMLFVARPDRITDSMVQGVLKIIALEHFFHTVIQQETEMFK